MNIESANLTSVASSTGPVETVTLPLAGGTVDSEGFSDTLVTQIGLLSDLKTANLLPVQMPDLAVLQETGGSQGVPELAAAETELQDFAALLGNDLPPSYRTKDELDHEAALAAVTDTLNYISKGAAVEEKVVQASQNVAAMLAKNERKVATPVVEAGQSAGAVTAETELNCLVVVESGQQARVTAVKTGQHAAAEVEQKTTAEITDATQSTDAAMNSVMEQGLKSDLVMDVPAQVDRDSDAPEKKQVETQVADIEDGYGMGEVSVTAMMLPTAIATVQEKPRSDMASADMKEENAWAFSIKPAGDAGKAGQSEKAPAAVLRNETVFRPPVQDKQGFTLKYFDNAGQADKFGPVESQAIEAVGERALPRVGTDVAALNRAVVEHKVEIPAITKPLSHPEWNKDLGERIVWMSNRAIPAAEIRLNPQHLGPISVRVDVTDDQASVVFTAQHATTREAIEASIPKLREMMGAQQLNLSEVSVSHGATSDQGRSQAQNFAQTADGRAQQGATGIALDGIDDVEQEIESGRAVVGKGLLSLYA